MIHRLTSIASVSSLFPFIQADEHLFTNGRRLKSHFLKIVHLLHQEVANTMSEESSCIRAWAETVTKRVMEYVEGAELDIHKLRGIGTDGASTMTGVKTGVVARLKVRQPSLIGVHCAAHRVNLLRRQETPSLMSKTFGNIIRQVFTFSTTALFALPG